MRYYPLIYLALPLLTILPDSATLSRDSLNIQKVKDQFKSRIDQLQVVKAKLMIIGAKKVAQLKSQIDNSHTNIAQDRLIITSFIKSQSLKAHLKTHINNSNAKKVAHLISRIDNDTVSLWWWLILVILILMGTVLICSCSCYLLVNSHQHNEPADAFNVASINTPLPQVQLVMSKKRQERRPDTFEHAPHARQRPRPQVEHPQRPRPHVMFDHAPPQRRQPPQVEQQSGHEVKFIVTVNVDKMD